MQNEFLTLIQKDFPITKNPFKDLSKILNINEDETIKLYKDLKDKKIIRQTSAIFDTKSLDYKSSLVAFRVNDIKEAAKFINTHPGVSHNYERDNIFNLWFTIAVEKDSKLGLENTIKIMAKEVNALDYIILPTKKMFKIKVQLDLTGKKSKKEKVSQKKKVKIKMDSLDIELIKELQKDIIVKKEPFEDIIKKLNIDYKTLEYRVNRLKDAGIMRRFASILYHRKAGFNANAMVVWSIDKNKEEELAKKAAHFSAVSHCYIRPTYKNWPYSLFTMIHAKTKKEIEDIVNEIEYEIKPFSYQYLYSIQEFKKERIKYFSPTFKEWEENIINKYF